MALTKTAVVDTALELLRESGLPGMSMRTLATRLGVQPSALYWHVP
ncbi:TetR family transcriptional regulator, partial [Dietzia sp. DQ11-71]|nr:TetR family transcriptional regulator [Dietzia sp. DQ11-71]